MNFFNLPIGAGRNDWTFGEVDGAPMHYTPGGVRYYDQYQPPPARIESLSTMLDPQGRAIHNRTPQERSPMLDMMGGVVSGVTQGLTAPGRALRGEPVTYGDAWATALDYGVGSAPTSAPEGALRSGGIKAYHGSPHDFDRFSMDKIGTGEGAQAYGHGLYFAESEDVARSYRDTLAQRIDVDGNPIVANNRRIGSTGDQDIDDALSAHSGDLEAAIADEAAFADEMEAAGKTSRRFGGDPRTLQRKLEALRGRVQSENTGHMYEVNINANPDDFLDWDAPTAMQSERVKEYLKSQGIDTELHGEWTVRQTKGGRWTADNVWGEASGKYFKDEDAARAFADQQTYEHNAPGGGAAYQQMGGSAVYGYGDPKGALSASERLREAGIPGIKYKDGMSRGAEGGTRNFVVFDEDLISIVRKYGIAGAATYLGMPEDEIRNRVGEM